MKKIILLSGIVFLLIAGGCRSHKKKMPERVEMGDLKIENINLKGKRAEIVEEALTWLDTPYGYARAEKGKATDCSGMVMSVYDKIAEIKLPRNSAKQAEFCKKIKEKDVKPGDLVFFSIGNSKGEISHVGIMIDKVRFVHASASKGVIISDMTTPFYIRNFKMYGRVEGI